MLCILDRQLDFPSLEVNDNEEDEHRGKEVTEIGQVLSVEGLVEGSYFVLSGQEEMDEGNESSLEFSATACVDCRGTECFPNDRLANVRSNEEGDTRAKPIALLQQLVEDDNDQASCNKLQNNEKGIASAERIEISIHSRHDVGNGLSNGNENAKQFLSSTEQRSVFLQGLIYLNDS